MGGTCGVMAGGGILAMVAAGDTFAVLTGDVGTGTCGVVAGDGILAAVTTGDPVAVVAGGVGTVVASEKETILAGDVGVIFVAGDGDTILVGNVGTGRHCWRGCRKTPSG